MEVCALQMRRRREGGKKGKDLKCKSKMKWSLLAVFTLSSWDHLWKTEKNVFKKHGLVIWFSQKMSL